MTEFKMLTIKEASKLIEGLTEYRVRAMCISGELPCIHAGRKYLINENVLYKYLNGEIAPVAVPSGDADKPRIKRVEL